MGKIPQIIPDPKKMAELIMNRITDWDLMIHNQKALAKHLEQGIKLTTHMVIKACIKKVRDYEPLGYVESHKIKRDITDSLKDLIT